MRKGRYVKEKTKQWKLDNYFPAFSSVDDLDKWYQRQKRMMLGLPIRRVSGATPFGYIPSSNSNYILLPVEIEFEALLKARDYLKGSSLRDVADWVTRATGRKITHEGLSKLMSIRPPDDRIKLPKEEREKLVDRL